MFQMAKINQYILDYNPKSYADVDTESCEIDCSLGVNPDPVPERVMEMKAKISAHDVKHYPHDEKVIDYLIEKFQGVCKLERANVSIGDGSIDVLCRINAMYLNPSRKAIGYAPQFSAYVDDIHFKGAGYEAYLLQKSANYAFDHQEMIRLIEKSDASLLYIDNPNNPTGQVIPLSQLEEIIVAADKQEMAVIIDEAYGDYMPLECSAACFINKYDNVFVTRSISKGYGLAGMRMGYVFGSKPAIKQLRKVSTPFDCNGLARELAISMLSGPDYLDGVLEKVARSKEKVMASLKKIKVAKTTNTVPISLLYTEDESVDLCRLLAECGVATVSGASFDNLDINSVRMMLCEEEKIPRLIALLQKAESQLK